MFSLVVLFYLADVCDAIHFACNTVFILMAIFLCIGVFVLILFNDCYDSDELEKKTLKLEKLCQEYCNCWCGNWYHFYLNSITKDSVYDCWQYRS